MILSWQKDIHQSHPADKSKFYDRLMIQLAFWTVFTYTCNPVLWDVKGAKKRMATITYYSMLGSLLISWHTIRFPRINFQIIFGKGFYSKLILPIKLTIFWFLAVLVLKKLKTFGYDWKNISILEHCLYFTKI